MPAYFRLVERLRSLAPLACACALALLASQVHAWGLEDVATLASVRARAPYRQASQTIPAELAGLGYDRLRDIRYEPASNLWRADRQSYEVNFFHVGPQGGSVRINEIAPQGVRRIPYDPAKFSFGANRLDPQGWGDLGHGGLRAFSHLNSQSPRWSWFSLFS